MFCPHCRTELEEAERCPKCEFDLAYCEKAFPFAAPPLQLVIDPSNLLPDGIEKTLRKNYQKLRKRTPQVSVSFCFVRLQDGVSLEEFAFWLHNKAPDGEHPPAWQLVVVGDLTSGHLTMTAGYALEPFLKPELWEAALHELGACICEEQWKSGLQGFLIDARELLTAAWHSAERKRRRNHERRTEEEAPPEVKNVEEEASTTSRDDLPLATLPPERTAKRETVSIKKEPETTPS